MSGKKAKRQRAERTRAPGRVVVGVDWAHPGADRTAYVCSCGAAAGSVEEVLLCKHEEER